MPLSSSQKEKLEESASRETHEKVSTKGGLRKQQVLCIPGKGHFDAALMRCACALTSCNVGALQIELRPERAFANFVPMRPFAFRHLGRMLRVCVLLLISSLRNKRIVLGELSSVVK